MRYFINGIFYIETSKLHLYSKKFFLVSTLWKMYLSVNQCVKKCHEQSFLRYLGIYFATRVVH